jgi:hypothetical protein
MSSNSCSAALVLLQVTVNPEGAAADALRQWWDTEGSSAALTPLGQAAAAGGAGGGPRSNKLQFLSDVLVSACVWGGRLCMFGDCRACCCGGVCYLLMLTCDKPAVPV